LTAKKYTFTLATIIKLAMCIIIRVKYRLYKDSY